MLENDTFKNVFTFDVFLLLKPQCTAKWHVFYIMETSTFQSALLFTSTISDPMTGRAGVWEADDIVIFYIALLDFFLATL